jgi:hypothetical protein
MSLQIIRDKCCSRWQSYSGLDLEPHVVAECCWVLFSQVCSSTSFSAGREQQDVLTLHSMLLTRAATAVLSTCFSHFTAQAPTST